MTIPSHLSTSKRSSYVPAIIILRRRCVLQLHPMKKDRSADQSTILYITQYQMMGRVNTHNVFPRTRLVHAVA